VILNDIKRQQKRSYSPGQTREQGSIREQGIKDLKRAEMGI
jgi:hypothetical protein